MTPTQADQRRETQGAIPYRVRVQRPDGTTEGGIVCGSRLTRPLVHCGTENIEISWDLAWRLLRGISPHVRA